eukprot:937616_1
MGLMWEIILRFEINAHLELGDNRVPNHLLKWVQEKMVPYDVTVTNFTSSWTDGNALRALVHLLSSLDGKTSFEKEESTGKDCIKDLMKEAKLKYGVEPLIDASDLANGNDELSCMTYVSFIKDKYLQNQKSIEERKSLSPARLEFSDDRVDKFKRVCTFCVVNLLGTVTPNMACDRICVTCSVMCNGYERETVVETELKTISAENFSISISTLIFGDYNLNVSLDDVELPGCSRTFTVVPPSGQRWTVPARIYASSQQRATVQWFCGRRECAGFAGDVQISVTQLGTIEEEMYWRKISSGKSSAEYKTSTPADEKTSDVSTAGEATIELDENHSESGGHVRSSLNATIRRHSVHVESTVADCGNGTYSTTFLPKERGVFRVEAAMFGQKLGNVKFVEVFDVSPAHCSVSGLDLHYVMKLAFPVSVQLADSAGRPLDMGGHGARIGLTSDLPDGVGSSGGLFEGVVDKKDGTYTSMFKPMVPGVYHVEVTYNGERIKGSPFFVKVEPDHEYTEKTRETKIQKRLQDGVDFLTKFIPVARKGAEFIKFPYRRNGKGKIRHVFVADLQTKDAAI